MAELYLNDIYILKYIDYIIYMVFMSLDSMNLDVINHQSGAAIWEDNSCEVELSNVSQFVQVKKVFEINY